MVGEEKRKKGVFLKLGFLFTSSSRLDSVVGV
jgi:hypothetical protein